METDTSAASVAILGRLNEVVLVVYQWAICFLSYCPVGYCRYSAGQLRKVYLVSQCIKDGCVSPWPPRLKGLEAKTCCTGAICESVYRRSLIISAARAGRCSTLPSTLRCPYCRRCALCGGISPFRRTHKHVLCLTTRRTWTMSQGVHPLSCWLQGELFPCGRCIGQWKRPNSTTPCWGNDAPSQVKPHRSPIRSLFTPAKPAWLCCRKTRPPKGRIFGRGSHEQATGYADKEQVQIPLHTGQLTIHLHCARRVADSPVRVRRFTVSCSRRRRCSKPAQIAAPDRRFRQARARLEIWPYSWRSNLA